LRLFFKIVRKAGSIIKSFQYQLQLETWKSLYKNRFSSGYNFVRGNMFRLYFDASSSKVEIGSDVQFRDYCQVRTGMNGQLKIGNRVFFNNSCSITCFNSITIGDNCQFGEGVKFYDHNHLYKSSDQLINQQGYSIGGISIGENCWIGSNVIILKNVVIGDNVVIGAGCVIFKSIPSNSVVYNNQNLIVTQYKV
jgi:acetyltransferase-like isoleucine patch superfamily enzyme